MNGSWFFHVISRTIWAGEWKCCWKSNWIYVFIFNWPIKYTRIQTTCITQIVSAGFWFHEHPACLRFTSALLKSFWKLWKPLKWNSPVFLPSSRVPPHQRASKEFVWFDGCVKEVLFVFLNIIILYILLPLWGCEECMCVQQGLWSKTPESTAESPYWLQMF